MSGLKAQSVIGGVVCLLLAGCASTPTADTLTIIGTSPGPTVDQTAQAASSTPLQATPTAMTQTPTPKPSPHPTAHLPDAPLSQEGPWLVFLSGFEGGFGSEYLWAINDDGTGLTKLVDEPVVAFAVRPNTTVRLDTTIAYIAFKKGEEPDYTLKLLSLPDGKVTPVTSLFKDAVNMDIFNLLQAIYEDGLKWSPDGSLLAFVSTMSTSSVDVYTYELASGAITRLSDHRSNAYRLDWSPDGRYLVYEGFNFVGMIGPEPVGVWAVHADGTGTALLFEEGDTKGDVYYEKWMSPTEIVLVNQIDWDENAYSSIRIVDVETGEANIVLEMSFARAAFAAEYNTWLLTTSYTPGPDTPLILYRQEQRQEIPGRRITHIEWLSAYDVFLGQTSEGIRYVITPDGEMTGLSMGLDWARGGGYYHSLGISPDEQMWAWYMSDLWIGAPMAEPLKVLSGPESEDPAQSHPIVVSGVAWSPDSQWLIALTDEGLYRVERPGLEVIRITRKVSEFWYGDGWDAAWIP